MRREEAVKLFNGMLDAVEEGRKLEVSYKIDSTNEKSLENFTKAMDKIDKQKKIFTNNLIEISGLWNTYEEADDEE
jgi:allophanate hydrolase subunit 1